MAWLAHNVTLGNSQIFRLDIMPLPAWTEMIPVFAAIVTIAGISIKIGRILQKIDSVIEDVRNIKVELKEHDKRLTVLENTTVRIKAGE